MSARFGDEKGFTLKGGGIMAKRVKLKGRPVWKRLPLLLLLSSY